MILTADYHTHTPYSHGKHTVLQNATVAKERGLKELGISDHGFSHLAFPLRRRKLKKLRAECQRAEELTGVKVLMGMEANILGTNGETDMKPSDYPAFDIFLLGKHVNVAYKFKAIFTYFLPNLLVDKFHFKPSKRLIERNTKAYIEAIKSNPVDVITHLGYKCPCDFVEVGKCAEQYGTYIELNAKKQHIGDVDLINLANTGVRFLIGSDAHTKDRVGEFSLVREQLERIDFPMTRIDNIDGRTPSLRFKKFKENGQA